MHRISECACGTPPAPTVQATQWQQGLGCRIEWVYLGYELRFFTPHTHNVAIVTPCPLSFLSLNHRLFLPQPVFPNHLPSPAHSCRLYLFPTTHPPLTPPFYTPLSIPLCYPQTRRCEPPQRADPAQPHGTAPWLRGQAC